MYNVYQTQLFSRYSLRFTKWEVYQMRSSRLASVYLFQTCEWNEDSNYVCIIFVCTQYHQIISKCFVFRWCWSRQQWEWKWNCTIIRHSNNWWAIPTQVVEMVRVCCCMHCFGNLEMRNDCSLRGLLATKWM